MNESPQQYFLTQAGAWLDRYGYAFNSDSHLLAIPSKIRQLPRDPQARLDLVKHLVLYTGRLWKQHPALFTSQDTDTTTLPDNVPHLEGVGYDKFVLETIINRCAQLPRREDVNLGAGWYMTDVEFPDAPNNSDEVIIETIDVYCKTLYYEFYPEQLPTLLNILLADAWELYLRAWEQDAY